MQQCNNTENKKEPRAAFCLLHASFFTLTFYNQND